MIGLECENYSFSRLISDLRADLVSYAKTLLDLEQLTFLGGVKILIRFPTFWYLAFHRYTFWVNSRVRNKFIKFFIKFFPAITKHLLGIITKSLILVDTDIGPGFCLAGKGVMLGAKKIGRGCIVYENVTLGRDRFWNLPEIGDYVKIGPNSIITGGIKIGSGVTLKESTVLTKSVPDNCNVQGNPGRIVRKTYQ